MTPYLIKGISLESPSRNRMTSYKTRAIVIKRLSYGESDRILTLFSHELGKLGVIAKRVRKSGSKLAGYTELFSESDFILSSGRSMDIITDASLVSSPMSHTLDLDESKMLYFFAEIIYKLFPDKQPNAEIYDSLSFVLKNIENKSTKLLYIYFVTRVLKTLGIYPELGVCLSCGEKPGGDIVFDNQSGGIFCEPCKGKTFSSKPVSKEVIKLWRFFLDSKNTEILRLKIEPDILEVLYQISTDYITKASGIEYNTLRQL